MCGRHPFEVDGLALAMLYFIEGVQVFLVFRVLEEVGESVILDGVCIEGGIVALLDFWDGDEPHEGNDVLAGRHQL